MDGHPGLAPGSAALAAACAQLAAPPVHRSFLWPVGGRHAPGGHLRITALTPLADLPVHVAGVVLVSPADNLNGLTPRELEVLGLLWTAARTGRSPAPSSSRSGPSPLTSSTSWSSS